MQDEFATDLTGQWYVSRWTSVLAGDLRSVHLPEVVVGSGGATLKIVRPIFVDDDQFRSFEAVLSYPGFLSGKIRVELDVNPYASRFGEIGIRPAHRAPSVLVSAKRYFEAAWSVLEALSAEISGVRSATGAAA